MKGGKLTPHQKKLASKSSVLLGLKKMNLWQGCKKAMENDIIDSFCNWPNFNDNF